MMSTLTRVHHTPRMRPETMHIGILINASFLSFFMRGINEYDIKRYVEE
tara:strand:- start:56 stop:202 length:147 start_codon:yes stop_codon:yes gene_type:complete